MKRNCVYNYIRNNYNESQQDLVVSIRYNRRRKRDYKEYILKLNDIGGHDTYELNLFSKNVKVTDSFLLYMIWGNANIIKTNQYEKYLELICEV